MPDVLQVGDRVQWQERVQGISVPLRGEIVSLTLLRGRGRVLARIRTNGDHLGMGAALFYTVPVDLPALKKL
jgi:hypothetical protein